MDKKYSEDEYLKGGDLDQFYTQRIKFEACEKIYKKFGDELDCEYFDFIDKASEFVKKFGVNDDPILTAILIEKLLYRGAFSVTNGFKYSTTPKYESNKCGISVISGKGCCRNISDFFEDLDSSLGHFVMQYNCNSNFEEEKLKKAITRPVNHVINIIADEEGNKIGFDITNLYFLKFSDAYNMKSFKVIDGPDLIYKPYYEYETGIVDSIDDISKRLVMFEEESKKDNPITIGYLIDKGVDADEICDQNESYIDGFKAETKNQKQKILTLQKELYKKY